MQFSAKSAAGNWMWHFTVTCMLGSEDVPSDVRHTVMSDTTEISPIDMFPAAGLNFAGGFRYVPMNVIAYDLVSPWTYLELVAYSGSKQCTWPEHELYWCLCLTDQNIDQVKCHRPSNTKLSKTLMKRCVAIQCFPLNFCFSITKHDSIPHRHEFHLVCYVWLRL